MDSKSPDFAFDPKSVDFGLRSCIKKSHGAEVHRGIKDTEKTVSGQQAHSEKVLIGGYGQRRSIETRNALLSLVFPYTRISHVDKGSVHQ